MRVQKGEVVIYNLKLISQSRYSRRSSLLDFLSEARELYAAVLSGRPLPIKYRDSTVAEMRVDATAGPSVLPVSLMLNHWSDGDFGPNMFFKSLEELDDHIAALLAEDRPRRTSMTNA